MSELKYEDPPARRTRVGTGKHAAIVAELKAHPDEWAVIDTFDSASKAASMAWAIKSGIRMRTYSPPGAYEAMGRTVDGEHRLYVRYVGERSE